MDLVEFERWLAQLATTGYRILTPESVNTIRQALQKGGTITLPEVIRRTMTVPTQRYIREANAEKR